MLFRQCFVDVKNFALVILMSLTSVCASSLEPSTTNESIQAYTLEQFVARAQVFSPHLKSIASKQLVARNNAEASDTMPDPSVSLAFANLPIGSFDFAQEPMTQFQVGVSQSFNRGDSAKLNNQSWQQSAKLSEIESRIYSAQLRKAIWHLWLELVRIKNKRELVEQSLILLQQVNQIANANYSNAVGRTRQSDVIRSQLEVTRYQEQLLSLQQTESDIINQLSGWIGTRQWQPDFTNSDSNILIIKPDWLFSHENYSNGNLNSEMEHNRNADFQRWSHRLLNHPEVKIIEQKVAQSTTQEAIVEQTYRPQWKLNASYGYRDDAPSGMSRDDFFSIGVSFDLPIFTSNKQDKTSFAASYQTQSFKYEKQEKLTRLFSQVFTVKQKVENLSARENYFSDRLLKQAEEQAEASLTSYTNDDGDFAEVIRARLDVLNLSLQKLDININKQKQLIEWNYLFEHFMSGDDQPTNLSDEVQS
ncbi:MAG: TolC family protein [Gammaproteobacteria bacterium]|nr:TolC family protein [Gammaproteobacteria bacterium]